MTYPEPDMLGDMDIDPDVLRELSDLRPQPDPRFRGEMTARLERVIEQKGAINMTTSLNGRYSDAHSISDSITLPNTGRTRGGLIAAAATLAILCAAVILMAVQYSPSSESGGFMAAQDASTTPLESQFTSPQLTARALTAQSIQFQPTVTTPTPTTSLDALRMTATSMHVTFQASQGTFAPTRESILEATPTSTLISQAMMTANSVIETFEASRRTVEPLGENSPNATPTPTSKPISPPQLTATSVIVTFEAAQGTFVPTQDTISASTPTPTPVNQQDQDSTISRTVIDVDELPLCLLNILLASSNGISGFVVHEVQRSDTLSTIATQYGVAVRDLRSVNCITADQFEADDMEVQQLYIPLREQAVYVARNPIRTGSIVTSDDLSMYYTTGPIIDGAITDINNIVGKWPVREISQGKIITEDDFIAEDVPSIQDVPPDTIVITIPIATNAEAFNRAGIDDLYGRIDVWAALIDGTFESCSVDSGETSPGECPPDDTAWYKVATGILLNTVALSGTDSTAVTIDVTSEKASWIVALIEAAVPLDIRTVYLSPPEFPTPEPDETGQTTISLMLPQETIDNLGDTPIGMAVTVLADVYVVDMECRQSSSNADDCISVEENQELAEGTISNVIAVAENSGALSDVSVVTLTLSPDNAMSLVSMAESGFGFNYILEPVEE